VAACIDAAVGLIAPDAHQSLKDIGTDAYHRRRLGQTVCDCRLASVGVGSAAFAHALAASGEDGLQPVVVGVAERPVVRLSISHDPVAPYTVVGGVVAVLQRHLGDDLRAPVVHVDLFKRAMGITPADAAGSEDLVEPLDDESGLDTGQLEATAGIGAQRFGWEGGLDGLHLILVQHGTPPVWYMGPGGGGGGLTSAAALNVRRRLAK
jgi:hypothetical protein